MFTLLEGDPRMIVARDMDLPQPNVPY